MATAALAGYAGSATGVTGVTEIKSWEATIECAMGDATSFTSSGWKEVVPLVRSGSGKITAVGNGVPPIDGSQLTLSLVCGPAGAPKIDGNARIYNVNVKTDVGGLVEFSADFTFDGAVTVGTV